MIDILIANDIKIRCWVVWKADEVFVRVEIIDLSISSAFGKWKFVFASSAEVDIVECQEDLIIASETCE